MDDTMTPDALAAARALVDAAALDEEWHVEALKTPVGLTEYDVFEGEGGDANSMALCYEESVAEFIAAAPELVRRLLADNAALRKRLAAYETPM